MKLFSKATLLPLAVCAALSLTACDKTTEQGAADEANAPAIESVEKAELMPLSVMTAQNFKYATILPTSMAGTNLTEEQKNCLNDIDESAFAEKFESYYKEKFSEEELKELNDFYGSEVGKKFNQFSLQQLFSSLGMETNKEAVELSEAELAEVMQLMQKPTFQKYVQLNTSQGEGSFLATFQGDINAAIESCVTEDKQQ